MRGCQAGHPAPRACPLEIQRPLVHRQGRLFGGLRQREGGHGRCVQCLHCWPLNSIATTASGINLLDHGADHVHAQNFIGFGVGQGT